MRDRADLARARWGARCAADPAAEGGRALQGPVASRSGPPRASRGLSHWPPQSNGSTGQPAPSIPLLDPKAACRAGEPNRRRARRRSAHLPSTASLPASPGQVGAIPHRCREPGKPQSPRAGEPPGSGRGHSYRTESGHPRDFAARPVLGGPRRRRLSSFVQARVEERRPRVHPPARGRRSHGRLTARPLPRPARRRAAPKGQRDALHAPLLARQHPLAQGRDRRLTQTRHPPLGSTTRVQSRTR
jgi:hypothetical protein